jgi:hypothetical protein
MNKTSRIRLTLRRTTLKRLGGHDLARAVGGGANTGDGPLDPPESQDEGDDCTGVSGRIGAVCTGDTTLVIGSAACGATGRVFRPRRG